MSRQTPTYAGAFSAGEILSGTYVLRDILGAGGMGQVWDAFDKKLGRPVAIKISWPHAPEDLLTEEAQAMAQLQHPSLPAVHALGSHEGVDYIVMERLYGRTLAEHTDARRTRPFTTDELLDILIGITDALGVIHRAGFVHRDLKTENVMLATGRVVLLDFGVMQTAEVAATNDMVFGSPHYLAPEAALLNIAADKAHLVDVYALGAMAFELVAGWPPFDAEQLPELIMRHVRSPVPDLRALRSDLPDELIRLVEAMLAKSPDERPYSMDIVGTALRTIRRDRHQHSHAAPLSVLIADDDPDIRLLLEACVENAVPGAQIRMAADGNEAYERFLAHPPHLMLLDLRMPGMNGIELCMHLRGTNVAEDTAILAVTAHATERDREALERLGVLECVNKRVDSGALISRLVELVRGIQQTRAHILQEPR